MRISFEKLFFIGIFLFSWIYSHFSLFNTQIDCIKGLSLFINSTNDVHVHVDCIVDDHHVHHVHHVDYIVDGHRGHHSDFRTHDHVLHVHILHVHHRHDSITIENIKKLIACNRKIIYCCWDFEGLCYFLLLLDTRDTPQIRKYTKNGSYFRVTIMTKWI